MQQAKKQRHQQQQLLHQHHQHSHHHPSSALLSIPSTPSAFPLPPMFSTMTSGNYSFSSGNPMTSRNAMPEKCNVNSSSISSNSAVKDNRKRKRVSCITPNMRSALKGEGVQGAVLGGTGTGGRKGGGKGGGGMDLTAVTSSFPVGPSLLALPAASFLSSMTKASHKMLDLNSSNEEAKCGLNNSASNGTIL
mmetsp:Transcript_2757/g.4319  ORF Transcript_2757/g.4319 Transcript_2757/m.4319 type:complete len:192 (-) Transcript_2757:23-598(-)